MDFSSQATNLMNNLKISEADDAARKKEEWVIKPKSKSSVIKY